MKRTWSSNVGFALALAGLSALATGARAQDPCTEPGPTIFTDPAGDATTTLAEHDVLSLQVSQPTSLGGSRFVFTLKMVGLATPTADTTWPVIFRTPDFVNRFVRMSTDAAGVVTFAHGLGTNPSPTTAPGSPADPASSFSPDGTIRIVVPAIDIGSPLPGQFLTQFLTRIRVEAGPAGALTPDNMPDSLVPGGSYTATDCGPVSVEGATWGGVKSSYR